MQTVTIKGVEYDIPDDLDLPPAVRPEDVRQRRPWPSHLDMPCRVDCDLQAFREPPQGVLLCDERLGA